MAGWCALVGRFRSGISQHQSTELQIISCFTENKTFKPFLHLNSLSGGYVILFHPVNGMDASGGGWSMPVDRLDMLEPRPQSNTDEKTDCSAASIIHVYT